MGLGLGIIMAILIFIFRLGVANFFTDIIQIRDIVYEGVTVYCICAIFDFT